MQECPSPCLFIQFLFVYKFKCDTCSRRCKLNKKLSQLRGRAESERVYYWVCDGQSKQSPHAPAVYILQSLSIMTDSFGRITSRVDKVTRIMIEDAEMHELLDEFKAYMREERYKRLKAAV